MGCLCNASLHKAPSPTLVSLKPELYYMVKKKKKDLWLVAYLTLLARLEF